MQIKGIRTFGKWGLCLVVLAGLVYSIVGLTAEPAYAASCTASTCNAVRAHANAVCGYGSVLEFDCPVAPGYDYWFFECFSGYQEAGAC